MEHTKCYYTKCYYAKCYYAECYYVECYYTKCYYTTLLACLMFYRQALMNIAGVCRKLENHRRNVPPRGPSSHFTEPSLGGNTHLPDGHSRRRHRYGIMPMMEHFQQFLANICGFICKCQTMLLSHFT